MCMGSWGKGETFVKKQIRQERPRTVEAAYPFTFKESSQTCIRGPVCPAQSRIRGLPKTQGGVSGSFSQAELSPEQPLFFSITIYRCVSIQDLAAFLQKCSCICVVRLYYSTDDRYARMPLL
jgi:hypothetical protein